jgi:predicted ester cyclase
MSTEQNRDLGARWAELWNADKNLDLVVKEIVAEDFVSHSMPPGLPPGREGVKIWASIFRTAFPDIQSTAEDVIVEGDRVVERFSASGTFKGEFMGIPPTGKGGGTTGINIFRVANGKIVEHWGNSDDLGMMQQMGVIPTMG